MLSKPSEPCSSCPLGKERVSPKGHRYCLGGGFTRNEGRGRKGILLVGEAPGAEEEREGLPFRPFAQSGSLLQKALKAVRLDREVDVGITNIVRCRPPNNELEGKWYRQEAVASCRELLEKTFEEYKPKVVVALGGIAFRELTGLDLKLELARGYVFRGLIGDCWVVPSFHPSYIRRGRTAFYRYVIEDLKLAVDIVDGSYKGFKGGEDYKDPDYQTSPNIGDVKAFYRYLRDNPNMVVAFDIENPITEVDEDSKSRFGSGAIVQVQFATEEGRAIAIPYEGNYKVVVKGILGLPNPKVGHNCWNYDIPVLGAQGIEVRGRVDDSMWMFTRWHPDLLRNLQSCASFVRFPFPWKHLASTRLQWYGCADADATLRVYQFAKRELEKLGVWRCYDLENRRLKEVLVKVEDRGIPVNLGKLKELERELLEECKGIEDRVEQLVPMEVRNYKVWKKGPKGLKQFLESYKVWRDAKLASGEVIPEDHLDRCLREKFRFVVDGEVVTGLRRAEKDGELVWVWVKPFNLGSSQQVIRYVKDVLGIQIDSSGDEVIEKLAKRTGDEVLGLIGKYRSAMKMVNNDIPNWIPSKDGRVHTTFGFIPPSGQLNSREPNIQNASKHSEVGKKFRKCLEAPEGYEWVEFDFSGFHILTMAWLADSRHYYEWGRTDLHSFVTSHIVGEGIRIDLEDPEERKAETKRIKERYGEIRTKQAKPTVLGNQLGVGARKLYMVNRPYIKSVEEAKKLQGLLATLFPDVEKWKDEIQKKAHRDGMLQNVFGRIQWFYDVFRYDRGKRSWVKGNEAEAAIAFNVQSVAFGVIFRKMIEAEEKGFNDRFGLVNTIHDSVVYLCPKGEVEECIWEVGRLLSAPVRELTRDWCREGMVFPIEVSRGKSLGEMETVEIG